jgi:Flp pilus assembly protein TadG
MGSSGPGRRGSARPAALRDGEQGQITVFVVVIMVALLAVAGLVYDGGRALAAKTTCIDIAQEAARAGAQQVNLATFRASGQVMLDASAAQAAAQAYLAGTGTGDTATVTVAGDTVTVAVSSGQPTVFLGLIGIRSLHVTGTATATAESGITGPAAAAPARQAVRAPPAAAAGGGGR